MQEAPMVQRRSSSQRRDHHHQNYSKPVRPSQFSPSPIRKSSKESRTPSTSSFPSGTGSKQFGPMGSQLPQIVPARSNSANKVKKESHSRHSHSQTSKDENKENVAQATPSLHLSIALIDKTAAGSLQLPHKTLEVDENGLYLIKPRPKDIADIKPRSDSEFCQPIYKQQQSVAPSITSDSKYSTSYGQPQMVKHSTVASQSTIADRRDQKLASKAAAATTKQYTLVKAISPQQLQLPIKDTSEGDPSVLSEARGVRSSDAISMDFQTAGQVESYMGSLASRPHDPLVRQNTHQVAQTNFFGAPTGESSALQSQNSSSTNAKKQRKEGGLQGRWTDEEHRLFLEGLELFKKDWRSIERHIGTRTCSQIRSHAQKYYMRLEKQQSSDCANKESGKTSSVGGQSPPADYSCEDHQMITPRFKRMKSETPGLLSATKKQLKFKMEHHLGGQHDQELSQSLNTLGATPDQQNFMVTPFGSGTKRQKLCDDPFKSLEKTGAQMSAVRVSDKSEKRQKHKILHKGVQSQEENQLAHQSQLKALRCELAALREQRNQLCAKFLRQECGIPHFCIQLDEIGKKLADNCLFASIHDLTDFTHKYDTETLVTRMLLKYLIEYLSTVGQLDSAMASRHQESAPRTTTKPE